MDEYGEFQYAFGWLELGAGAYWAHVDDDGDPNCYNQMYDFT